MLKAARALSPVWEQKLARYGLAMCQLISQEMQVLPGGHGGHFQKIQFDHELNGGYLTWKRAQKRAFDWSSYLSLHVVPVKHAAQFVGVPWAFSNEACRAVLLAMYPGLVRRRSTFRRYAARAAFMLYAKYRLGQTESAIAEKLGVTVQNVEIILRKLRRKADPVFQEMLRWERTPYSARKSGKPE